MCKHYKNVSYLQNSQASSYFVQLDLPRRKVEPVETKILIDFSRAAKKDNNKKKKHNLNERSM